MFFATAVAEYKTCPLPKVFNRDGAIVGLSDFFVKNLNVS